MTYLILEDYQHATRSDPRAYAGRVVSMHSSRVNALSALGRLKARLAFSATLNPGVLCVAICTGSQPTVREEISHSKILPYYLDFHLGV